MHMHTHTHTQVHTHTHMHMHMRMHTRARALSLSLSLTHTQRHTTNVLCVWLVSECALAFRGVGMEYRDCGAWVVGVVILLVASASAYVPISAGTAYGGLTVAAGGRSCVAWCSGMSCFPTCPCILRTTKVAGGGRLAFAQRLQASAAGGDDTDSFDITKM